MIGELVYFYLCVALRSGLKRRVGGALGARVEECSTRLPLQFEIFELAWDVGFKSLSSVVFSSDLHIVLF